jgi:chemotaxis protein MotA
VNNLVVGIIAAFGVIFLSLEGDLKAYFQMHSIIIVVGGTAAILIFSTPGPVLKSLWHSILDLFKKDETLTQFKDEILKLNEDRTKKVTALHPLTDYAQELWQQGVDSDLFVVLVSQKKKEIASKKSDAVQSIKNLAKYPPTLGMMGTVMGMIDLFGSLDSNKGNVGQSLSIAMTATFFGLILANILIAPLADRLHVKQVHQHRTLDSIYELLLLINQGEPSSLIKEEVHERAG